MPCFAHVRIATRDIDCSSRFGREKSGYRAVANYPQLYPQHRVVVAPEPIYRFPAVLSFPGDLISADETESPQLFGKIGESVHNWMCFISGDSGLEIRNWSSTSRVYNGEFQKLLKMIEVMIAMQERVSLY